VAGAVSTAPPCALCRDVAHLGQGVEIEDADVAGGSGAGDIEVAAIRVGGDVIESAIAADELNLEDLVGAGVLCMSEAHKRNQRCECCNGERLAVHSRISIKGIRGSRICPEHSESKIDSCSIPRLRIHFAALRLG
jgi:hypothetical protein